MTSVRPCLRGGALVASGTLPAPLRLRARLLVAVDGDGLGRLEIGQRPADRLAAAFVEHFHGRAGDDVALVRRRVGEARACRRPVLVAKRDVLVRFGTLQVVLASAAGPPASDTARSSPPSCRRPGCSCGRCRCRSRGAPASSYRKSAAVAIDRTRSVFLSLSTESRTVTVVTPPLAVRSPVLSSRTIDGALERRLVLPELRVSRVGGLARRSRCNRARRR